MQSWPRYLTKGWWGDSLQVCVSSSSPQGKPHLSLTLRNRWIYVRCVPAQVRFCSVIWQTPPQLRFEFGTVQHCWTAGVARPRSSRVNWKITPDHSYVGMCYKHKTQSVPNRRIRRNAFICLCFWDLCAGVNTGVAVSMRDFLSALQLNVAELLHGAPATSRDRNHAYLHPDGWSRYEMRVKPICSA